MSHTLLHIDASARLDGSVTRQLSAKIVEKLAPGKVIHRDLTDPLPHLNADWLAANWTPEADRDPLQQDTLALSDALIAELKAADTIVIGTPIYNFGVPAALKAWIDLVCRAGETFRYTEEGPIGLLTGKRAVIAIASGGTPVGSEIDFASGYLRHILGFVGITDVQIVSADRVMARGDEAVAEGTAQIDRLVA
jgi:FMN-dependent NADH-azoreductase